MNGTISSMSAVTDVELVHFNGETKAYDKVHLKENLEVVFLKGNLSKKDREVFP